MSYTVFNVIGGLGDDLAGGSGTGATTGSDTGGTGTVTQGGGAGGGTKDLYAAASGTPFSATQVGDYISIYTGAATIASYVAQVTAVNSGGLSVDYQSTTGIGTRPTNGITYKAKTGGCWNTLSPLGNFGAVSVPSSTQVNVKQATYSLSGALTVNLKGATTAPLWIRGYNATVGDLDNGSTSLSYPSISQSGNAVTFSGGYTLVTALSFTGSIAGNLVATSTNPYTHFRRCRFNNTNSGSTAAAVNVGNAQIRFAECWFQTPSTAAQIVSFGNGTVAVGCWFAGAGTGTTQVAIVHNGGRLELHGCTIYQPGSHGISESSGADVVLTGNTFYNCGSGSGGGDGVHMTSVGSVNYAFTDNAFYGSGQGGAAGYDINNATGTNTANVYMDANLTYNAKTAHLNGFGDWAEQNPLSDSAQSYVSSTDLHLVPGSAGASAGLPGQWENQTAGLTSKPDVGAWQRDAQPNLSLILQPPSTY